MSNARKHSRLLLFFVKLTGWLPALIFFKPKRVYAPGTPHRLPKGCILMSNHTSLMDFPFYLTVFPFRTLHFLMAEVLFRKGKLFSAFLYAMGGIYVDRDARNFGFVERSQEILSKGGTVGIFPEGRLPVDGKPFPFKPGVVYLALRTGAPLVPAYTAGRYGLFRRSRVVLGEPIDLSALCRETPPSAAELERLTRLLQQRVYALADCLPEGKR